MISFFRELPFQVQIRGELSLVQFAAGFSKVVDPLSGMTVNLKQVNSWFETLPLQCFRANFTSSLELLETAHDYLQPLAKAQGAVVTRVQLHFENQDLLQKNSAGKIELQRSWWVTDQVVRQRVQVTATFSLETAEEIDRCQSRSLDDQQSSFPEDLFRCFPIRPSSIEVRDPLTGLSRMRGE